MTLLSSPFGKQTSTDIEDVIDNDTKIPLTRPETPYVQNTCHYRLGKERGKFNNCILTRRQ